MTVAKTLEDIITEQAPIVCEQIEAADADTNNAKVIRLKRE